MRKIMIPVAVLLAAAGFVEFRSDDATQQAADWFDKVDPLTAAPQDGNALPTDMQVIGAVQRAANESTVAMCAAGTMPGELHKLWKAGRPGSYHMEYGFSCMGYEIAGALGIKMAEPERDVICFTGDGTYMMANSEMATAAMMAANSADRAGSSGRGWCSARIRRASAVAQSTAPSPCSCQTS